MPAPVPPIDSGLPDDDTFLTAQDQDFWADADRARSGRSRHRRSRPSRQGVHAPALPMPQPGDIELPPIPQDPLVNLVIGIRAFRSRVAGAMASERKPDHEPAPATHRRRRVAIIAIIAIGSAAAALAAFAFLPGSGSDRPATEMAADRTVERSEPVAPHTDGSSRGAGRTESTTRTGNRSDVPAAAETTATPGPALSPGSAGAQPAARPGTSAGAAPTAPGATPVTGPATTAAPRPPVTPVATTAPPTPVTTTAAPRPTTTTTAPPTQTCTVQVAGVCVLPGSGLGG